MCMNFFLRVGVVIYKLSAKVHKNDETAKCFCNFYYIRQIINIFSFNVTFLINKSGLFNVPFGRYQRPTICDPVTIYADSELLQKVEILTGDFEETFAKVSENTFFYFDPPYRPLSDTSSFNDYSKEAFNDAAQIRLKEYCDKLDYYCIGFMSMYNDYIICRDISRELKSGNRYTMYRTSGVSNKDDMKLYCIPADIDLLDPRPACINIAEGPFSILGAYLHCNDIGNTEKNSLWLANCGAKYKNTLLHVTKQFGLLRVKIFINAFWKVLS